MDKINKHINKIITVLALAVLLRPLRKIEFLLLNIVSVSVLFNGFNEVRDYVSLREAHLIMQGINPYVLENINMYHVPMMFMYPPLYTMLVAALCKITKISLISGFYAVNIILVVFTAFFIWLIVKDFFEENKFVAALCTFVASTTFVSLFGMALLNFHTDTIGIFVTALIFLLVYKKKECVLPIALLSILLMFTKQILLVLVVPLFIYYLITDRKLALKYFLYCFIGGLATLGLVQLFFPLYWTETIYVQFLANQNPGNFYSVRWNLYGVYNRYGGFVLLVFIGLALGLFLKIKSGAFKKPLTLIKDIVKEHGFAVYMFLNVGIGTLSLLYFAKVEADGFKYCQDILSPSIFILAAYVWSKSMKSFTAKKKVLSLVTVIMFCMATTFAYLQFKTNFNSREGIANRLAFDNFLQEHAGEKMFLTMSSMTYMLNRDMWESDNIWFDDGQIEYFNDVEPVDGFLGTIFYDEEVADAAHAYVDEVNEMVRNQEFDVVCTFYRGIIDRDLLIEYYDEGETFLIMTDTNGYTGITTWTPKQS